MKEKKEALPEFIWPEFTSERERIKTLTKRYERLDINEAFNDYYKLSLANQVTATPIELNIGDTINVKVRSVECGRLILDCSASKDVITCVNSFKKYKNLPEQFFQRTFKALVVDKKHSSVYVDIIKPLFNEWISSITNNIHSQYDINKPAKLRVRNLQLMNNGFVGNANITPIGDIFGGDFEMEVFVPGSQIVLNIERDFNQWIGKDIDVFVSNYIVSSNPRQKPLICSRKQYLSYLGDLKKIDIYKTYCDDGEEWNEFMKKSFKGKVTGVINSSKKSGVFVELTDMNITGLVNMPAQDLVKYSPNQIVDVNIVGFDEMTYIDEIGQKRHLEPYVIEDDKLRKCILKPMLKIINN